MWESKKTKQRQNKQKKPPQNNNKNKEKPNSCSNGAAILVEMEFKETTANSFKVILESRQDITNRMKLNPAWKGGSKDRWR